MPYSEIADRSNPLALAATGAGSIGRPPDRYACCQLPAARIARYSDKARAMHVGRGGGRAGRLGRPGIAMCTQMYAELPKNDALQAAAALSLPLQKMMLFVYIKCRYVAIELGATCVENTQPQRHSRLESNPSQARAFCHRLLADEIALLDIRQRCAYVHCNKTRNVD
jgi:hypothetical protein